MTALRTDLKPHPVAEIFPPMSDVERSDLVADIQDHGLREPIWLHRDGRIIDGRNRHRACVLASVEPAFRTYEGDDSELVAFVISLNLKRRHLNESQRAIVAAKIATLGNGQHAARTSPSSANLQSLPLDGAPFGAEAPAISRAEASRLLNVSERSTASASKVIGRGVPELVEQAARGDLPVSVAASIANAPHEEQREVVSLADKRELRARANAIQERNRKPAAPAKELSSDLLAPADRSRRRQGLNKAIQAAQDAYAALSDYSGEELALFLGENPSLRDLLAMLRDQYVPWLEAALVERPNIRSVAGGTT